MHVSSKFDIVNVVVNDLSYPQEVVDIDLNSESDRSGQIGDPLLECLSPLTNT